jgi:hypothetical protein
MNDPGKALPPWANLSAGVAGAHPALFPLTYLWRTLAIRL